MSINWDLIGTTLFPSEHNYNTKVILNNYITKKLTVRKSDTLCVLCPPWHVGELSLSIIKHKLKKRNFSFLSYNFHPDVLSVDYKSTRKYILNIIDTILKDIKTYKKKYKFKKVYLIGFSLGCLYALNVAVRDKDIKKIILSGASISLADAVWTGLTTKKIKEVMIEQFGLTLSKLDKYWKPLNVNNIKNLKDKEIHLLISKNDRLTRFNSAMKLVNKFKKNKVDINLHINKYLGHYGTCAKLLLFPGKYLK